MKKILLVSLLSGLWLTACGQKGPLYLPPDQSGQEQIDPSVDQSYGVSSIQGMDARVAGTGELIY